MGGIDRCARWTDRAGPAETLPDRTRFSLAPEQWAAFQALLDAEPRANPRLVELLENPGFFDPPAP